MSAYQFDLKDAGYEQRMQAIHKAYDLLNEVDRLFVDEAVNCIVEHVKKTSKAETGQEMRFSPMQAFEVVGFVMMFVLVKEQPRHIVPGLLGQ